MTLQRMELKATLLEPLAIRANRQSTRSEGLTRIPGSTILGALASAYLQWGGHPRDREFQILFQDESHCRWGALRTGIYQPPATSASCKRFPGLSISQQAAPGGIFPAPGSSTTEPHGLHDLLVAELRAVKSPDFTSAALLCQKCGEPLQPYRSPLAISGTENNSPKFSRRPDPPLRTRHHVGIDRNSGTAAEGILFAEETLDCWLKTDSPDPRAYEAACLTGVMEISEPALEALKKLLDLLDSRIEVGSSRSRGLGRLSLDLGRTFPATTDRRLDDFSAALTARIPDTARIFTLAFPEGAIFVDDLLRFTNDPAAAIPWLPCLPRDFGANSFENGITALHGNAGLRRIRGWQAAHGLPKNDDLAIEPGSLFAYEVTGEEWPKVKRKLLDLTSRGAGLRRNEGFGRVQLSDPFHLEFAFPRSSGDDPPATASARKHPPSKPRRKKKKKRRKRR